jgi:hypothetical protein
MKKADMIIILVTLIVLTLPLRERTIEAIRHKQVLMEYQG